MASKPIEIVIEGKGIKELKTELRELKQQLAESTDPATTEKLAIATGKYKDRLTEVNEQIAIFASGSDFEKVSNGLGLIGGQLASMDFEGASESAKLLTNTIKGMSPDTVAAGFKGLISTIGQLSNAFIQMGLKLLANPLFLLVAIIGGIVIAFVMLKDKIKILEVAFNYMTIPIKMVIQALKDLADWMGLTAFAAEESADRQAAAAKRSADASAKYMSNVEANYSRRIALLKAEGKETKEAEKELNRIRQSQSYQQVKITEDTITKKQALLKNATEADKEKLNKELEDLKKYQNEQIQINLNAQNSIKVIEATAITEKREANKKAIDEANERLKNANKKAEQELENHKKNLLALEEKYKRDLEDLDADTDEKKLALQKKRELEELERTPEKLKTEESYLNAKKNLQEKYAKLEAQLVDKKNKELEEKGKTFLEKFALDEKTFGDAKSKKELDAMYADSVKKLEAQEEIALKEAEALDLSEKQKQGIRDFYQQERDKKDSEYLEKNKGYATEEQVLYNELGNAFLRFNEIFTEGSNESNALKEANLQISKITADGEIKTMEAVQAGLAIGAKALGESTAAGKALAIANTTIDTFQSSVSAYKGMVAAIPGPVGIAAGAVAAAASIATGIATVKKIVSVKVPGKGGSGGSVGGAGAVAPPAQPTFNLFGNANRGNEATSSQTREATPQAQPITVRAVVSETEVTETQQRVQRIQQNAEL